jgi:hypothetical protein
MTTTKCVGESFFAAVKGNLISAELTNKRISHVQKLKEAQA